MLPTSRRAYEILILPYQFLNVYTFRLYSEKLKFKDSKMDKVYFILDVFRIFLN